MSGNYIRDKPLDKWDSGHGCGCQILSFCFTLMQELYFEVQEIFFSCDLSYSK